MLPVWKLLVFGGILLTATTSAQYSMHTVDDMSNNNVLRTYRRCVWEQSKFLPRRLVLLSLCSNLFCENNQLVPRSRSIFVVEKMARPNDCLDILPDLCIQGDEEELMYKPFPDCCPVYCNLKRRMNRLRSMHLRHRTTVSKPQIQQTMPQIVLSDYNLLG